MLFHVYSDPKPEGYFDPATEPFGIYRTILDADWLLYLLLPLLAVIVVAVLMVGWHIHELPKHKADHKKMRQTELVTALTLLGLLEHWVWAVALFIAYMDWNATEEWFVKILRTSRVDEAPKKGDLPTSAHPSQSSTVAPPPSHAAKVEPVMSAAPEVKS